MQTTVNRGEVFRIDLYGNPTDFALAAAPQVSLGYVGMCLEDGRYIPVKQVDDGYAPSGDFRILKTWPFVEAWAREVFGLPKTAGKYMWFSVAERMGPPQHAVVEPSSGAWWWVHDRVVHHRDPNPSPYTNPHWGLKPIPRPDWASAVESDLDARRAPATPPAPPPAPRKRVFERVKPVLDAMNRVEYLDGVGTMFWESGKQEEFPLPPSHFDGLKGEWVETTALPTRDNQPRYTSGYIKLSGSDPLPANLIFEGDVTTLHARIIDSLTRFKGHIHRFRGRVTIQASNGEVRILSTRNLATNKCGSLSLLAEGPEKSVRQDFDLMSDGSWDRTYQSEVFKLLEARKAAA